MKVKRFIYQQNEAERKYKLELINKNLLLNYKKILNKEPIKGIINNQIRFVTRMDLNGKKKHSSIKVLEDYNNSENKTIAFDQLTNYLSNKLIF